MSDLEITKSFDFISCFLYSIHYCASITKLQQTFQRVYHALAPGGLFCFDAVDKDSIANDQGHCHNSILYNSRLSFQTRWHYKGSGDLLTLYIDIQETRDGQPRTHAEHHTMTAVKVADIRQMLQMIGFDVVVLEHDFTRLAAWQGVNGNVVFCAVKTSSPDGKI